VRLLGRCWMTVSVSRYHPDHHTDICMGGGSGDRYEVTFDPSLLSNVWCVGGGWEQLVIFLLFVY
jgi:hypothetical protein